MFRLFLLNRIPDLGLTSGQEGVDMVKGSDPFWESGKLRVGVAEIEMIPTVDGGSRNLGRKSTVWMYKTP